MNAVQLTGGVNAESGAPLSLWLSGDLIGNELEGQKAEYGIMSALVPKIYPLSFGRLSYLHKRF